MKPIPDLDDELRADEGVRYRPYLDTKGRWACGVGCDLKAHGLVGPDGKPLSMDEWSDREVNARLAHDLLEACALVREHLPWSSELDPIRLRVLVNMMFNMGWGDGKRGLSSFKNTLKAIREGRWDRAEQGILDSKFARQDAPARAQRMAYRIKTGQYHMPAGYYPPPPKAH